MGNGRTRLGQLASGGRYRETEDTMQCDGTIRLTVFGPLVLASPEFREFLYRVLGSMSGVVYISMS